jgi:hypothetical protein
MQCSPFGPNFERWAGVGTMTSLEIGIAPVGAVSPQRQIAHGVRQLFDDIPGE